MSVIRRNGSPLATLGVYLTLWSLCFLDPQKRDGYTLGDLIPLLSPADSGFAWIARDVMTQAGPRVALLQEPIPEPLTWQDTLLGEVGYGEGLLGTVLALTVLWGRLVGLAKRIKRIIEGD